MKEWFNEHVKGGILGKLSLSATVDVDGHLIAGCILECVKKSKAVLNIKIID